MNKRFFEVFPDLKTDAETRMLFEEAEIQKVTTNTERTVLRAHLFCRHLIQKPEIFRMEKRIKEQLFAEIPIRIHIREQYQLSEK